MGICSAEGMEANEVLKVHIAITAITRRRMNFKTSRRTSRAVMNHFGVFPPHLPENPSQFFESLSIEKMLKIRYFFYKDQLVNHFYT